MAMHAVASTSTEGYNEYAGPLHASGYNFPTAIQRQNRCEVSLGRRPKRTFCGSNYMPNSCTLRTWHQLAWILERS